MASGRPVICTPNAGSVVRDGVDGYIVNAGDVDTVVERLTKLIEWPERRCEMALSAAEHATRYDLQHYGERLIAAITSRAKARAPRASGGETRMTNEGGSIHMLDATAGR